MASKADGMLSRMLRGPTDEPSVPHWRELIGTSVFAALFLASAALFRKASRAQSA